MITITPIYAALLAILFVALSFRVIGFRRANRVSLGDGDNSDLLRRVRVHGNFAEYVPFALLLMLLAELQGTSGWVLHMLGLLLLTGRILHAVAITNGQMGGRVGGMVLTFLTLISAALINLALATGLNPFAG